MHGCPVKRTACALIALLALLALLAGPAGAVTPDPRQLATLGIKHVFVINVENKSYDEAYVSNPNPYLPKVLRRQGVLLKSYYGIGHLSLPNYIGELSGQAPNAITQSDCQLFQDFLPGAPGPMGQSIGQGCIYPADVKTLPDQLDAAGLTWRGYMGDMGNDLSREPDRCGEPSAAGLQDGTQSAKAKDQYAARHNPFIYFHSILDSPRCHQQVLPLTGLQHDLAEASTTANFTFITPNLCDDGHDAICVGKNVRGTNVGGLTAIDYWLQKYVPMITSSPAYQDGGLLIVTADESENADATACCGEAAGFNTPRPGITGPGGGVVGTLVIGHCVAPGGVSTTPYNHYSLLRSLEDVFGITTGGSDGKGHLGYAGAAGLAPFGPDVFQASCAQASPPIAVPHKPSGGGTSDGGLAATGGLPLAPAALILLLLLATRRLHRKAP